MVWFSTVILLWFYQKDSTLNSDFSTVILLWFYCDFKDVILNRDFTAILVWFYCDFANENWYSGVIFNYDFTVILLWFCCDYVGGCKPSLMWIVILLWFSTVILLLFWCDIRGVTTPVVHTFLSLKEFFIQKKYLNLSLASTRMSSCNRTTLHRNIVCSYQDPGISDFCPKSFNYSNLVVSSYDLIKKIVKTPRLNLCTMRLDPLDITHNACL